MHESSLPPPASPAPEMSPEDAFLTRNPATGEALHRYRATPAGEVAAAIQRARAAVGVLARTSLAERARLLQDIADRLESNALSLARRLSLETGKPLSQALETDMAGAIGIFRHTARRGPRVLRSRRHMSLTGALLGRWHREEARPVGVVGLITPWNYPAAIAASGLAPALMAGDAVVFKPSELAPDSGLALAQAVWDALTARNLPTDALALVQGGPAVGEALSDGAIDHCLFTGSAAVGWRIRDKLAARGIPCSLELGGSCPMIILPGAPHLAAALSHALFGRLVNAGQTCGAVKRLYVPRADLPNALETLTQAMQSIRVGDPLDPATHMGPLISQTQRERLHAQTQDAVARGARLLCGGEIPQGSGWFYPPTLLTDVPSDARALTEETFGPALPVITYDTVEEAVSLANDSPFALTASVFGPPRLAAQVARQLEAPLVGVNDLGLLGYSLPGIPWRGRRASGWGGGTHGDALLEALSERRYYASNATFRFPGLDKPPWHFHRDAPAQDWGFSAAAMRLMSGSPFWRWLRPALLRGFLKRRASRQW